MDSSIRYGAIVAIALVMFAIIIVGVQRSDRKYPPQFDARTSDAFESLVDKLLTSELTSEYEPSTGNTEATLQKSEKTLQVETTASSRESTTVEAITERTTLQNLTTTLQIETTIEAYVEEVQRAPIPGDYIGTFELTAYEWTGYPMANGEYPYYGACASNYFALGTVLYIEGYGTFTVCDRGGMANNVIDIYLGGVQECIEFGRRTAEVYYG